MGMLGDEKLFHLETFPQRVIQGMTLVVFRLNLDHLSIGFPTNALYMLL
jgi:hypothetical protein